MKNSKKIMFISGLIGIGTGLFISGIVLSILLYKVNNAESLKQINIKQSQKDELQVQSEVIELKPKNTPVESKTINPETDAIKTEPEIVSTESDAVKIKPKVVSTESQTIAIEIKSMATAKQIAALLGEKGVVADSNEFLTYIVSQNASRVLQRGTKIFTLDSDNETTLKVLTTYE